MSVLRIFNVSDYIHAGAVAKKNSFGSIKSYYAGVRELPDGSYAASRLPTGGISFMLNPIFECMTDPSRKNDILVFCVDDVPLVKREMYKSVLKDEMGYKATRRPKPLDVSIQRDAIKDVLSLISDNVFACDGYEADDIIASLVKKYKDTVDHIHIHTRDSDLFSLVDDNVSIDTVGVQGKVVTKDNYSSVVISKDGLGIPFNSILLDKLYYGDRSDNIPGVGEFYANKIRQVITPDKYSFLTNFKFLKRWVGMAVDSDPYVMGILDLIIPLPVYEIPLDIVDETIDITKTCFLGHKVQNKYCKNDSWMKNEYPDVVEVLNCYTDDYYMRGGRCNG